MLFNEDYVEARIREINNAIQKIEKIVSIEYDKLTEYEKTRVKISYYPAC